MFIYAILLYHVIWPDDYLTFDAHMIPTCYHLKPDTWPLISDTGIWHVITWHLILDPWYLTPVFDMLISDTGFDCYHLTPDTWSMTLDNWHAITYLTCFHMVLVLLTWCCDTWLDTVIPDTCITLHIHDYYFYGDLTWLLYCYQTFGTPELMYSWTPVTGRLLLLYSWYCTLVDPIIG